MVKKKRARPQQKANKKPAQSSKRVRGRKARTPVLFSPSAKGSGASAPELKKRSSAARARGVSVELEPARVLRFPDLGQQELRDIGELTFSRRKASVEEIQPEGAPPSATNAAQRQRVTNVTDSPWRKICDLLITASDGSLHTGTAWFISPRTLVTAGHCIFVAKSGIPEHGMVRSILVMPARNGEADEAHSPFGWIEVPRENLRVRPEWEDDGNMDFDYGAIILPADAPSLGERTGFFGYGHFLDQDLLGSAPTLSGYPDNVPEGTQWRASNLIKEVEQARVAYNISTSSGQSGSPLFFRNDNRQIACAIHTFGNPPLNSGVRINQQVIAQLNTWKV